MAARPGEPADGADRGGGEACVHAARCSPQARCGVSFLLRGVCAQGPAAPLVAILDKELKDAGKFDAETADRKWKKRRSGNEE